MQMPRVKRGLSDGQIYHVINRGNCKQNVFHKDQDFRSFLELIKPGKEQFHIDIYAYCLMPNHFHFVLSPHNGDNLSKWMQWIMTCHVRRYHKHYKTTGHIWQGRFKSFLIQKDNHLLNVLRYVEANPMRAGLTPFSRNWIWSSLSERIGEKYDKIIDNVPIELPIDWEEFVNNPITDKELESINQSVNRQSPYGNPQWQKKMCQQYSLEHTLRQRGRPKKLPCFELED